MEVSDTSKKLAKDLNEQGFATKIYVDADGDPLFVSAWHRELIVSHIFPKVEVGVGTKSTEGKWI